MKKLLGRSVAFLFLLTAAAAPADVVVYKGPAKLKADIVSSAGLVGGVVAFYIVDFQARQIASVSLLNYNGQKKVIKGSIETSHFATANIKGGKTVTLISTSLAEVTDANTYRDSISLLRGTNTTLIVQQTPTLVQLNRPRVMSVVSTSYSAQNGDGRFTDTTFTMTFQAKATLTANDAGQTLAQALDAIVADFVAKGYSQ